MSFRKFQCDSGSSSPFFDYVIVIKPVSDSEFCQNAERKSVNRDSAPQDSADRDSADWDSAPHDSADWESTNPDSAERYFAGT